MASNQPKRVLVAFWVNETHARSLYEAADARNIPIASIVRRALFSQTENLTNFDDLPPDPVINRRGRFIKEAQH